MFCSTGKRTCIGQRLVQSCSFTLIASLLSNFNVSADLESVQTVPACVALPPDTFAITLSPRNWHGEWQQRIDGPDLSGPLSSTLTIIWRLQSSFGTDGVRTVQLFQKIGLKLLFAFYLLKRLNSIAFWSNSYNYEIKALTYKYFCRKCCYFFNIMSEIV